MKTKAISNRIISFLIAFVMVIVPSLSYSIPVKANIITTGWEKFDTWASKTGLKFTNILPFALSQWGCLTDGNFEQWIMNQDSFLDYWNDNYVDINEETDDITFSPDFVSYIKQALKEYQNEQYGYQILPTLKYDQIPVSNYNSAVEYRTMCELVKTYKIISTPYYGGLQPGDVTPYIDGTAGFYITSYYTDNVPEVRLMDFTTWENVKTIYANGFIEPLKETVSTFEDLVPLCNYTGYYCRYSLVTTNTSDKYVWGNCANYLVSYTGCDVLVFNNATSLKNYSVDKRGVFTTKDFYEDTGELTLKLDDLNNSIGDLTDLLSQFKDLLGKQEGGLTEEQLQQLLQQFLDDFFERLGEQGGESGGGGSSGGGGTSGGGASSSWYDSVLDYLNNILKQLKSIKRWTVVDTVIDGVDAIADWLDLIHDVLSDADDGAESAVATLSSALDDATGLLKSKFPFSIPWDILLLVTVFAADPEAPYFEIPIQFDISGIGISIDYTFVVDFKDYEYLSQICRAVLSMIYAVGLMKMTANVAMIKKED